jgi:tetratricopeptide (TPR) repeat protein
MSTERPYLQGWFPWFKDPSMAADFYEGVAKNAPATEYAPMALMKIALLDMRLSGFLDSGENAAKAIDALKRLINDYPQSMLASNAYLELADIYAKLVIGPAYDQGSTRQSIRYLEDYLYYYKDSPDAPAAEKKRNDLLDTYARSQIILGDFYYYYRNSNRAALIFYNQAVTLAPSSPAAAVARAQIDKIRRRVPAPMTPYDMLFGRYNDHALSATAEQGQIEKLAAQAFASSTSQDFAETPGPEVVETIAAGNESQAYESFEPYLASPGVPPPPPGTGSVPSAPSNIPVQGAPPSSDQSPPDRPLIR